MATPGVLFQAFRAIEMLAFIMVYKLGDALAAAMTRPFCWISVSHGPMWHGEQGFRPGEHHFRDPAGGGVVARMGINRSLWVFAFLQAFSNLAFAGLALVGKSYPVLVAASASKTSAAEWEQPPSSPFS